MGYSPNSIKIRFGIAGIWVIFLLFALTACGSDNKNLKVGDAAPQFTARDINNNTISLAAYKGSPVIMRFFLPDCKYCKADTPIFNAYFKKYADIGLKVLYINTSQGESDIADFVKDLQIAFPVINDPKGKIAGKYRIKAVPQTVILNPDLEIATAILGGVSEPELEKFVGPFLETQK